MENFTAENLNKYAKYCGKSFNFNFGGVRFAHNLKSIMYLEEIEEFVYIDEVSSFFSNGTTHTERHMTTASHIVKNIEGKKWE